MPTICPKCQAPRPADTKIPDWQCPACGIAYSRAAYDLARAAAPHRAPAAPVMRTRPLADSGGADAGFPWGKLAGALLLVWLLYAGYQLVQKYGGFDALLDAVTQGIGRIGASVGDPQPSQEQRGALAALAAGMQAQDVVLYSADWCPHCREAKSWLAQYGFKYHECNVEKETACARQLNSFGGGGGIPHLIVKGRHMQSGFDSDEFVALLSK